MTDIMTDMNQTPTWTPSTMGKKGGAKLKEKYGTNHFAELGKKGMKVRWSKQGRKLRAEIAKMQIAKMQAKRKKEEKHGE